MSNKFNLDAALTGAKVKFRDSPLEISQIAYFPERAANGHKPVLVITTEGQAYWRTIDGLGGVGTEPTSNHDLVMVHLGTGDIPLPESKPLALDDKFYAPVVGGRVRCMTWFGDELAYQMLRAGRVFLEYEAARRVSEDIDRFVKSALEEAGWSCDV